MDEHSLYGLRGPNADSSNQLDAVPFVHWFRADFSIVAYSFVELIQPRLTSIINKRNRFSSKNLVKDLTTFGQRRGLRSQNIFYNIYTSS